MVEKTVNLKQGNNRIFFVKENETKNKSEGAHFNNENSSLHSKHFSGKWRPKLGRTERHVYE